MKLSTRLTTLAIAAVAVAGVLGAQQRNENRSAPRAQAPRAQASQHTQAPRGRVENRGRQDSRPQQYASSRADVRGGNGYAARPDPRGGNRFDTRNDPRAHSLAAGSNEFRGRPPVADHGRPLITRGGIAGRVYGRPAFYGGARYGYAGYNRFGGRLALPFGWESRIVVRGFFPVSYASYCEPVPPDYEYMLPEMLPNYDSCLFGDRIVVLDRFSRGIVFTAMLR
jgi:hypothetical protein